MDRAGRDGKVVWYILLFDSADLTIQEHFIRNAKPAGKCYEIVLQHLHMEALGLHDLMREIRYAQASVQAILIDLEEQGMVERNPRDRTYCASMRLEHIGRMDFSDNLASTSKR